jgi:nucleotide-binding universal stress UspA family protein
MSARGASVVVGYDGSESAHGAVVWAAEDAAQRNRALTVVSAVDYAGLGLRGPAAMGRLWLRDARERVALIACEGAELGRASVPGRPLHEVRSIGEVGRPVCILVEQSRTADLLVVGLGARSALAVALGSVAEPVATLARCPVVVVGRGTTSHPGPDHPVVVGIDGSLAALSAVDTAAGIAVTTGAPLRIVGAWMPSPTAGHDPYNAADDPDPEVWTTAGARDAVDAAVAHTHRAHPCLDVRGTEVEGRAAPVLAAQSASAGLLVVRSRGRGAVQALLLGSVSHAVARSAPCPVALVGPNAAASAFQAAHAAAEERRLQERPS